jgi:hypothetical protein
MSEKTKEQSAIDAIYSIEQEISNMSKRMKSMEDKVTLVLNKLSKMGKQPSAVSPVVKIDRPKNLVSQQKVQKLLLGSTKVFGAIVNKGLKPLVGVLVNVYDDGNDLVKSVKTDDSGSWEVRLPAGRYGVEYLHKNFKPVNKTIEFSGADKTFEVK